MKIFEKLKRQTEKTETALWREYRTLLESDNGKDAPRLAELLVALGKTERHVLFDKAVLLEAKMMQADVLLLEPARKAAAEAEKRLGELNRIYCETLLAIARQQEIEPKLRRRAIVLAERESDLAHLHRRFPELLGATEAHSEFPDNPPARLRNLAKDLGLPKLAF